MSTALYYFSATGNSLTTARLLQEQLIAAKFDANCRLVPVTSTKNVSKVIDEADTIGFVFPIYYGNMPYPVREMISKMVFKSDAYIFIVSTYRGHSGDIAGRMDQLLKIRGQKLSLSLGLPMPGNSFINPPEVDAQYLAEQSQNIANLLPGLLVRQTEDYATTEVFGLRPVDYPNNFRGITTEDHCTGCGICVKVCPMNNIQLQDGKAVIGDDCSTCLACIHWCPVKAIWMSKQENIARRDQYRHPDVTLADIIAQK